MRQGTFGKDGSTRDSRRKDPVGAQLSRGSARADSPSQWRSCASGEESTEAVSVRYEQTEPAGAGLSDKTCAPPTKVERTSLERAVFEMSHVVCVVDQRQLQTKNSR